MNTVCEVAFAAPSPASLSHGRAPHAVELWTRLPELVSLDLYTPARERAQDPYVQDGLAPACT